MKNNILSKDEFVAIMNQPDCSVGLLHTLSKMFTTNNDSDGCVWIEYFVFELDFGRDYVKGLIQDKDGNEIMLRNAEDLYDLLITNMKTSE